MVAMSEDVHELPDGGPFLCTGPVFVVRLRADVSTTDGELLARAGLYEARDSSPTDGEREITIWSPDYFARGELGGGWVGLPDRTWTLVG